MSFHYLADIDGVIAQNGCISAPVREILQGIWWSPVTGRGLYRTLDVLGDLRPSGPAIMCNGGLIANLPNDILQRHWLPTETLSKLEPVLRLREVRYGLFSPDDGPQYYLYATDQSAAEEAQQEMRGRIADTTFEIDMFLDWAQKFRHTKLTLRATRDISCPSGMQWHMNGGWLDIVRPRVTKGTAVIQLLDHLGIRRQQVVVMGNGYNDIDMFELEDLAYRFAIGPRCPRELLDLADDHFDKFEDAFLP